jgi:hypothetical protein
MPIPFPLFHYACSSSNLQSSQAFFSSRQFSFLLYAYFLSHIFTFFSFNFLLFACLFFFFFLIFACVASFLNDVGSRSVATSFSTYFVEDQASKHLSFSMHVFFVFISNFLLDFKDFKVLLCPHVPFYNPCVLFQSVGFCLLFYNSTYTPKEGVLILLKLNQVSFYFFHYLSLIYVFCHQCSFFGTLSLSLFMCIVARFKIVMNQFLFF